MLRENRDLSVDSEAELELTEWLAVFEGTAISLTEQNITHREAREMISAVPLLLLTFFKHVLSIIKVSSVTFFHLPNSFLCVQ